jgi:hypothetical protein
MAPASAGLHFTKETIFIDSIWSMPNRHTVKGEKSHSHDLFSDNQSWEISEIAQAAATIEKEVYSRFR